MMINSKTLLLCTLSALRNPSVRKPYASPICHNRESPRSTIAKSSFSLAATVISRENHLNSLTRHCTGASQELFLEEDADNHSISLFRHEAEKENEKEEIEAKMESEDLEDQRIGGLLKEIATFTGPAAGLWVCGPLMSLIDTAVIGQGGSTELAALGPGTVFCDHMSYMFMFLSVATSNMVATSLTRMDKKAVQRQVSVLLFVGLACGLMMLLFSRLFGTLAVTAFTRGKNTDIIPVASTYIQIRGLAWPAILLGLVAQSASSWGPLKALAVATVINGLGHVVLCIFLKQGIAGAAWATMISQVVSAYMMMDALSKKGYNAFSICIPSAEEFLNIAAFAAPVFLTIISKVGFYSLIIYCATSMGTHVLAAHQVMVQTFQMCNVWGEPLSQTAQSFMPEFLCGENRSLPKARMLLKSLVITGAMLGLVLGCIGTSVPSFFPRIYTQDEHVVQEMHKVLVHFFMALFVMPINSSLEGTLLAARDLKFVSSSMGISFVVSSLIVLIASRGGYGLPGFWFSLVVFQWGRFIFYLLHFISPGSVLAEDANPYAMAKVKAT